jgi:hypothetical protein
MIPASMPCPPWAGTDAIMASTKMRMREEQERMGDYNTGEVKKE